MTAQEMLSKLRRQKEEVAALKEIYTSLFVELELPEDRQWHVWLNRYDFVTVGEAMDATATWYNRTLQKKEELEAEGKLTPMLEAGLTKTRLDIVKYLSGTMKHIETDGEK